MASIFGRCPGVFASMGVASVEWALGNLCEPACVQASRHLLLRRLLVLIVVGRLTRLGEY